MAKLFANGGNPDQMLCSVASDLGLHCLPSTRLRVLFFFFYNGLMANGADPDQLASEAN